MEGQKVSSKERFPNESWKRVLGEIVKHASIIKYEKVEGICFNESHPLVKDSKVQPEKLDSIMKFLEEQGLIKYEKSECYQINLTSKGLDVGLQIQNQKLSFRSSLATIILAAIVAFMSVATLVQKGLNWDIWLVVMAFLAIIGYEVWKQFYREKY